MKWTKAAQGAALLAAYGILELGALENGSLFGRVLSVAGSVCAFVAFWFLQQDASTGGVRERRFILAAVAATFITYLLPDAAGPFRFVWRTIALLAIAGVMVLPLWLPARWERRIFIGAATLVVVFGTYFMLQSTTTISSAWTTDLLRLWVWVACLVPALGAAAVAWRLGSAQSQVSPGSYSPRPFRTGSLKSKQRTPRVVVASNIVRLSPEDKQALLAALDAKFQAGEIAEHKYWDKKQELESR